MATEITDMKEVLRAACKCLTYLHAYNMIPETRDRLKKALKIESFHSSLSVEITPKENTYQLSVKSAHRKKLNPVYRCFISIDNVFELANAYMAATNKPLFAVSIIATTPTAPPAPNPFINMSQEGLNRIAEQSDKGDRDDIKALQDRGDSKSSQDGVDAPNPDAKLDADVNIDTKVSANPAANLNANASTSCVRSNADVNIAAKVSANSDVTFAYQNLQNAGQKADENTTSKISDSGLDSKENQIKPDKRK